MIRKAAADPAFLAGVLDHVVGDEPLLVAVAAHAGVTPQTIESAQAAAQRTRLAARGTLIRWPHSAATALPTRRDASPRCPACGSPRLARHGQLERARDRACRLRCLLRDDREARRSNARRQAADHRRRQTRRRFHRLLCGAHLRHPFGDADVQGAQALPARDRADARHGEVRARRARGPQADAGTDPAGRAAVDRRGVHGPDRHRAAAPHEPGARARALRQARRERGRHHGVDRAFGQQVPRQDRLRPRQAARLRGARQGRGGRVPGAAPGRVHLGRRQGEREAAAARRVQLPSRTSSVPTRPT